MSGEGMRALFGRARSLSCEAEKEAERLAEEGHAAYLVAVRDAQDRLMETLLEGFEARVEEAARKGQRELELMAFEGTDSFDGWFFTLYLVKGPRQPEPGVEPLLVRLRTRLAPFKVHHVWTQGTAQNKLVVSWADR